MSPPDESPALAPEEIPAAAARLGPYRLLKRLGQGGQGAVYLAEDLRLRRKVAVKVLTSLAAASPRVLERFRREAETASRLDHPGICTVFDTGVAEGVPYLVMRYVEGETLARRLVAGRAGGTSVPTFRLSGGSESGADTVTEPLLPAPAPPAVTREEVIEAVRLIEESARALHVAHEAGVVHRDVKPGNIMIGRDGRPVILDFGLARDLGQDGEALTLTGECFGTPAYMSPEQVGAHGTLDRRTDVWSLGVTLYECLAGRRPFEGATREALARAILGREPADLRRAHAAVTRDLWTVVQTALAKEPARRYVTAAAFADDLRAVAEGRPVAARPIGTVLRLMRWARRAPAQAALLILLLAGLPALAATATYVIPRLLRTYEDDRMRAFEDHLAGGFAALQERRPDRARRLFERALELDPGSPEAAAGRIEARLQSGDPAQIEALAAMSEDELEKRPALRRPVAHALHAFGREEEAARARSAVPAPVSALDHFFAGQDALQHAEEGEAGAAVNAVALARQAIVSTATPRRIYHAQWLHAAGAAFDGPSAAAAAAAIRLLWPDDLRMSHLAGRALTLAGLPAEAEPFMARAIGLDPRDPAKHNDLAVTLWKLGRLDEALASAREACRLDPSYGVGRSTEGHVLLAAGRPAEAVAALREAVRIDPAYEPAHVGLAVGLQRQGDLSGAAAAFREAAARERRAVRKGELSGLALLLEGRRDEAREALEASVRTPFASAAACANLAVLLVESGRPAEAEPFFRRAIAIEPGLAKAHSGLASLLDDLGRPGEALAGHAVAVRADPWDSHVRYNAGNAALARGRVAEALGHLREAVRLDPRDAEAHCNLGHALREAGRFEEALAELRLGHELGIATPGWRYASARWITECEELARSAARLDAVLAGDADPRDARESLRFAEVAALVGRDQDALRLFPEAFAAGAGDRARPAALLARAARAAARALRAGPAEGESRAGDEIAAWPARARGWLREALLALRKNLDGNDARARAKSLVMIHGWLTDPDLSWILDAGDGDGDAARLRDELRLALEPGRRPGG